MWFQTLFTENVFSKSVMTGLYESLLTLLPNWTFTELWQVFIEQLGRVWHTYSSGHLLPSHSGLAYILLIETNFFPNLSFIFSDHALPTSIGTFSILLCVNAYYHGCIKESWHDPILSLLGIRFCFSVLLTSNGLCGACIARYMNMGSSGETMLWASMISMALSAYDSWMRSWQKLYFTQYLL